MEIFMNHFVSDFIRLPDRRECEKQAQLFHRFSPNFPAILTGAIDGTYVPMYCSAEDDKYYRLA